MKKYVSARIYTFISFHCQNCLTKDCFATIYNARMTSQFTKAWMLSESPVWSDGLLSYAWNPPPPGITLICVWVLHYTSITSS